MGSSLLRVVKIYAGHNEILALCIFLEANPLHLTHNKTGLPHFLSQSARFQWWSGGLLCSCWATKTVPWSQIRFPGKTVHLEVGKVASMVFNQSVVRRA